jgi:tetratricopeptide (TPR) repeat protein
MKSKIIILRVIHLAVIACIDILVSVSCSGTADREMVRLYAHASEAYGNGQFTETRAILSDVKQFPPALMLRAKAEYFSGDLERAEKTCRLALKRRPSSFEARLYLTRILREKGDLRGAMQSAETMLADNPQDIRALRLASELAGESGREGEASILLDKAAELSAESAMVLLERARLRWVAGRGNDALEDLGRARAMLPWNTPLLRSITNLENRIKGAMQ